METLKTLYDSTDPTQPTIVVNEGNNKTITLLGYTQPLMYDDGTNITMGEVWDKAWNYAEKMGVVMLPPNAVNVKLYYKDSSSSPLELQSYYDKLTYELEDDEDDK